MRPDSVIARVIRPLVAALAFAGLVVVAACGARSAPPATLPQEGALASKGASAEGRADGGAAVADAASPPAKPFAGSAIEATQLIGIAIDKNAAAMKKCIGEYRARKKLPHERVEVSVGIDQEGRLLGATLKGGRKDAPLADCVQQVLTNAPFPRSHAGVIAVTKSYEEIEQ